MKQPGFAKQCILEARALPIAKLAAQLAWVPGRQWSFAEAPSLWPQGSLAAFVHRLRQHSRQWHPARMHNNTLNFTTAATPLPSDAPYRRAG